MRLSTTREVSYDVEVVNLTGNHFQRLRDLLESRRSTLITTPSVDHLLGESIRRSLEGVDFEYHVIQLSEKQKNLQTVQSLCARTSGLERTSVVVAVGGGVCTDLVSMTAAVVRRGLECIRVPTTLIGQVDAGIGLKCGVNYEGLKSRIGLFHPPINVLVDPTILRTLPLEHISYGLAEIIKIAIVTDEELFYQLDEHLEDLLQSRFQNPHHEAANIVRRSIALMLEQLGQNPFEMEGYQRLVDFGHTFSPLIESEAGFSIHHGNAVALDMALSSAIGALRGTISWKEVERIYRLLHRAGLPLDCPYLTPELCVRAIANAEAHRGGCANLVVPQKIGAGVFLNNGLDRQHMQNGLARMGEIVRGIAP